MTSTAVELQLRMEEAEKRIIISLKAMLQPEGAQVYWQDFHRRMGLPLPMGDDDAS